MFRDVPRRCICVTSWWKRLSSAQTFRKFRTSRSRLRDQAGALRAAAGIRDPMTLMTRLCVRILTLTEPTARKASWRRGKERREEDERSKSGDGWPEKEREEEREERKRESILQRTTSGGNKRLLEASRGEEEVAVRWRGPFSSRGDDLPYN